MKILVVDDERWIRKGIVKMIQGKHKDIDQIEEADGLNSGWEMVEKIHPDILLADVRFPVGNGCQLCEKVHASYPETKIIMLSGYADFEFAKAALQYKALDYLLKPVDACVLNDTIERAVSERKSDLAAGKKAQIRKQEVSTSDDIVADIIKGIKENYWEKISLSNLAEKYHINAAYLSELFSRTVGVSLVNYQMNIRVEKAKSMLLMTNESVTEISGKVGYEDSRYFTRVFKKITKMSPKEYREKTRLELEDNETQI